MRNSLLKIKKIQPDEERLINAQALLCGASSEYIQIKSIFKPYLILHPVPMNINPEIILKFWFEELSENDWFARNNIVDDMISRRFLSWLESAEKGELYEWRMSPEGRLAEIIILDQFSRNIHRGTAHAFRNDPAALILSQEMILTGADKLIPPKRRVFAYMPFMHSESKFIHEKALMLFKTLGEEESLKYEVLHKEIIDHFGRFPHRNKILGRNTTLKENEFLNHHPGF